MLSLLADRYELRSLIARGGMAEVYRAYDQRLGREVAVKVLDPAHSAESSFVERFRRQARAAAGLNHPNVVTVYDWGQADQTSFIVMEHVDGRTLKEIVDREGPLPESEALEIATQVAAALEAAHQSGIVHRDVKPHNVLLDRHGQVKVTDFGIARVMSAQITETTSVLGTVHYLSPEQAQKQAVDGRSDLYSLGVVLYEMLTGRVPFGGDSALAVALQHLQDPPPLPSKVHPGVSPLAESVVLKALAKDPSERYQSAAEMARALRQAQGAVGRPSATASPATVQHGGARTPGVAPFGPANSPHRSAVPSGSDRWRGVWMLAGPLLMLVFVLGVLLALSPSDQDPSVDRVPTPAEARGDRATVPVVTSTPRARSTPAPEASGADARPADSARAPTPRPTAEAAVASPRTQAPDRTETPAGGPVETVASFYEALEQGRFEQAAQL